MQCPPSKPIKQATATQIKPSSYLDNRNQQILLPALHSVDATDQLLVLLVVSPLCILLQVALVHHARHVVQVDKRAGSARIQRDGKRVTRKANTQKS